MFATCHVIWDCREYWEYPLVILQLLLGGGYPQFIVTLRYCFDLLFKVPGRLGSNIPVAQII